MLAIVAEGDKGRIYLSPDTEQINISKLDKSEIDNLVRELNELSDNEKKNKERMKEIAHILTLQYLHK